MSRHLRRCWSDSKVFRVILVLAVLYALLRLAVQGAYLVLLLSQTPGEETLPEWVGTEGPMIPVDLQVYLDAARRLRLGQEIYAQGSLARLEELFHYAPSVALVFIPFLWLQPAVVAAIHTLLHLVAYALLYVWWGRIFRYLRLGHASKMLAWCLPLWLVFSAFWSDLGYLNVYVFMALLSTLAIDAILRRQLGWSLLWSSIILQVKPQWAFALAVPLFLGQRRFFLKLAVLTLLSYVVIAGATILMMGPKYGWSQHVEYVRFLARLRRDFPWRTMEKGFLGYNHSITQIVTFVLGATPGTMRLAFVLKSLILGPLAIIAVRYASRTEGTPGPSGPRHALDLAFVLYLGAFIWLDMVWELTLGIALFTYLLATLERRAQKTLVIALFLPYALVDLWQLFSVALFGMDVIAPGPYVLTDPTIYVPLIMIVMLVFYALLIKRLRAVPASQAIEMRRDES